MQLYHVIPIDNVPAILEQGLIPRVGERSAALGEQPGVFFFPTLDDMETALAGWLGDAFPDDQELASLIVTLPDDFPLESPVPYERVSRQPIPPACIRFFRLET